MARIRIVDEWLRSPASAPVRGRTVMVVAEKWAEQRVLMRAYAGSQDQTRPTIVLRGAELAIGPAGTDPHGEWGIHVEPPVDGRAQELRSQLETAARRLAGSRGNPPRLQDELPTFERKATNNWDPGSPRDRETVFLQKRGAAKPPAPAEPRAPAAPADAAPAPAASPADPTAGRQRPTPVHFARPPGAGGPVRPPVQQHAPRPQQRTVASGRVGSATGRRRRRGWTNPLPCAGPRIDRAEQALAGSRTVHGFAPAGAPPAPAAAPARRAAPRAQKRPNNLASMVGYTLPIGFQLSESERSVLNALGRGRQLRASEVAEIAGVSNGVEWMEALMTKLAGRGLDLVAPGEDAGGEPTYVLRT